MASWNRGTQLRAATIIGLGLLWLTASIPAAVAQDTTPAPVPDSQRIVLRLQHVPVSTALRLLFASVHAKNVIDPAVMGELSVDIPDAAFSDALRTFLDAADQPLRCSFKDGVYSVTVQRQPEGEATASRVGVVSLPPGLAVANKFGSVPLRPEPLPFAYTAPDGSFRAESSKAVGWSRGGPGLSHMLLDGTVVIKPLVPGKVLSVSSGAEWP